MSELPQEELLQQRMELGAVLGLDQPVPAPVLEAALRDESYAHNLLATRRIPAMLQILLSNPPQPQAVVLPTQFTNAELIARATAAIARWAGTGFSVVDQPTLKRRQQACLACPNLTDAPAKLLYRLSSGQVCRLCGCKVQEKIRLPTESCPDRDPEREGLSRWGEDMTP